MNLGVPKVLWDGDEEESWVDLYNRLYQDRCLFLFRNIDDDIVNKVGGMIIYFNIKDPLKDLFLFINSRGGSIRAAITMYNLITELPADVNTVALGICASTASLILIGGTLTKRSAFPHARIMICQPEIEKKDYSKKTIKELLNDMHEIRLTHQMIVDIYIKRSGNALWPILQDLRQDVSMSAQEALDHGIVDSIVNKELLERMGKGMGMGEDGSYEDQRKVDREQSE